MESDPASVLIVDDEPQICGLIRNELSSHGFRCLATTDAQEAKRLLDDQKFDLLIADIAMPKISGLDLLAHAKHACPGCRVVLITGFSNREHLAQALILGAYDFVEKPFTMDRLAEVASRAVSGSADIPELPARAAAAMEMSSRTKQAALDSVRALSRAVEAKDPYTQRHSEQVTHYGVHLARFIGLPDATVESIRIACLLHDIGKIGVPDHILTKAGKLTDDEFEYIRRHPALGADILANITLFGREARLVRYHHERWDGEGYPEGLAGEEIPLGSRIINVADSIDAMLMHRTYKQSCTVRKMLDELVRSAGAQFAPPIAAAAFEWCRANPEKLIRPGAPRPDALQKTATVA